ncbi:hypothetical protein DACRYDRAFT_39913, partial [Dacryopinax primogenitus]
SIELWTPNSQEWKTTEQSIYYREYNKALDSLKSLVVQHLFELEKLNLCGTG